LADRLGAIDEPASDLGRDFRTVVFWGTHEYAGCEL
jgi:hypothetical protein